MLDVVIQQHAIRIGARLQVSFQRTLRIPDDGRTYPLPPGLGVFPLYKVENYRDTVPAEWRDTGGAFIPMYQREALWLGFDAAAWKPNAVQVGIGGINAVSGEPFGTELRAAPQNYLVCPDQPWLDGINAGEGRVRQFVAMPLGLGYTVEASLTGSESVGGVQIAVFEPRPGIFPDAPPKGDVVTAQALGGRPLRQVQKMGLGAGGAMRQKIYADPHGVDTWDPDNRGQVVVHIVNSEQFAAITGTPPPAPPIDARTYTEHGLPWFDLYDECDVAVRDSGRLTGVKTVAERDAERGTLAADPSVEVDDAQIRRLHPERTDSRVGRPRKTK